MAVEQFSLDRLATMDGGRLGITFSQLLRAAENDCKDRPGLLAPRKIAVALVLRPVMADNGELESIDVGFEFDVSLPKRKSKTYNMQAVPGGLLFNDASPEDIRQRTLDMAPRPSADDEDDEVGHAG